MSRIPSDWPNAGASRSVRAGGVDWHVQDAGRGPVLLLLHGTGAATHSWRVMLPALSDSFRVVAPDLPGHGFTRGSQVGGLTLPAIGRALADLLRSIDAEPVLIVAHSAGAAIAVRMVLDGMPAVRGIVAIAPALLPFPGIAQHVFPTMAKLLFVNPFAPHIAAQIARGPGAVERFLARSTGSTIDPQGIAAYARLFQTSAHCAGALGMMANWDLVPLKAALPSLAVPVLILHGSQDAAIPLAGAREAAALIPDATVEVLVGFGHLAHEEAPAATVARIIAFAHTLGLHEEGATDGREIL